jgi:hypothetical protein
MIDLHDPFLWSALVTGGTGFVVTYVKNLRRRAMEARDAEFLARVDRRNGHLLPTVTVTPVNRPALALAAAIEEGKRQRAEDITCRAVASWAKDHRVSFAEADAAVRGLMKALDPPAPAVESDMTFVSTRGALGLPLQTPPSPMMTYPKVEKTRSAELTSPKGQGDGPYDPMAYASRDKLHGWMGDGD